MSPVLPAQAGHNFEVTLDVGQGKRAKSAEIIEEKLTALPDDQRSEQQQADPPQVCGHCNPAGEACATPGNCSNKIAIVVLPPPPQPE